MIRKILLSFFLLLCLGLNAFGYCDCPKTIEEALVWIQSKEKVTYDDKTHFLDFGTEGIEEGDFVYLCALPHLKKLIIDHSLSVTGEGLVYLLKFKDELELLWAVDANMGKEAFEILSKFTNLKELNIGGNNVNRETIVPILDSDNLQKSLKKLYIYETDADQWVVSEIGKRFQLKKLAMGGLSMSYEEIEDALDSFKSLDILYLDGYNFGDDAFLELFDTFNDLNVEILSVNCNNLTDISGLSLLGIETLRALFITKKVAQRRCPEIMNHISENILDSLDNKFKEGCPDSSCIKPPCSCLDPAKDPIFKQME